LRLVDAGCDWPWIVTEVAGSAMMAAKQGGTEQETPNAVEQTRWWGIANLIKRVGRHA